MGQPPNGAAAQRRAGTRANAARGPLDCEVRMNRVNPAAPGTLAKHWREISMTSSFQLFSYGICVHNPSTSRAVAL